MLGDPAYQRYSLGMSLIRFIVEGNQGQGYLYTI